MSLTVGTLAVVSIANLEQKQLAKWYTSKRHHAPMYAHPYASKDGHLHERQPWDGGPLPGDDSTPEWVEDPDDEIPDPDGDEVGERFDPAGPAFGGPAYRNTTGGPSQEAAPDNRAVPEQAG